MYIVHIKIALHIQVLVYCKKCSDLLANQDVHYALHDLDHVRI